MTRLLHVDPARTVKTGPTPHARAGGARHGLRLVPPPEPGRAGLLLVPGHAADKYRQLDRLRRHAQIRARHLLDG